MSSGEKFKQHLRATGRMERRRHRPIDWLGLAVFVSVAILVSSFLSGEIKSFVKEKNFLQEAVEFSTSRLEFQWNVNHNDSTPEKTYEELRQALLDNDLEATLATIHPASLYKYEEGLRDAAADGKLPQAATRMTSLKEKIGEYEFSVTYSLSDSSSLGEVIEFTRDGRGMWKISSI